MILEAIAAGDFRTRLDLQSPVQIRSSDGGYQTKWVYIKSVWSNFIPLDNPTRPARNTWSAEGKEFSLAGQIRSQQKHIIFIRWQPENIQASWRLVTKNAALRVFNITEVMNVSNVKKMIRLVAIENISQKDNGNADFSIMLDDSGGNILDNGGGYVVA